MEEGEKFSITDTYYTEIPQRSERSAGAGEMRGSTIILGICVVMVVVVVIMVVCGLLRCFVA